MADSWCTIESDPGVFTELIEKIGVEGVQVEELYSLDDETMASIEPIYGFIFLFKYDSSMSSSGQAETDASAHPGLFFAKQVINNACATQAIISVLLNVPQIEVGATLAEYKDFAASMDPELRGLALSNQETIKRMHNSFARPEPFVMESARATKEDDVYHFVSYIPFGDSLYELDGLQAGPINHGPVGESWLAKAREVIAARIEKYASSEIRFNLLAVVKNRRTLYCEDIVAKKATLRAAAAALQASTDGSALDGLDMPMIEAYGAVTPEELELSRISDPDAPSLVNGGEPLPADLAGLRALAASLPDEITILINKIQAEKAKYAAWQLDNIRRKHNYVPFIVAMLKHLARKGELIPLINGATADA
ncbi:uncharacterized protein AMSG_11962 [Thecamonas trahens ATCC 50062]|uniref:Ubiquitin carboxyl-terminal hydrolase n=1 Tax=Thecamonas trahens ATCC 50062 TaxID=461836 RepID=A0A0L0DFR7_THETB|nr:hypothetical protein AMSG_11962 [Thecamonas trahens ATCC 50062]KNC50158.1 hypothetical protein AMSG_11962 [Thecamonas trahens ATCC 50062]|eukprot:XP_013757119.1 hypothetical protein AMSG_11962 [Thecamonas trahens ATCC 50062]